jgi:hypothetical protein
MKPTPDQNPSHAAPPHSAMQSVQNDGDELLSRGVVARMLSLEIQTLAAWAHHRKNLPYIKVGKAVRYRRKAVEDFLRARTVSVSLPDEGSKP